ncbi:hypothetical protein NE237_002796 [Protea cynaroides]|uniref:Uncharacterized protein n=1 Tax=Protea cynaroides TaxID=273540 RepID=A0A9Q0KFR9_9MAGN|nr:hypothetical protein NE237_002796 [Protea cynaroides]
MIRKRADCHTVSETVARQLQSWLHQTDGKATSPLFLESKCCRWDILVINQKNSNASFATPPLNQPTHSHVEAYWDLTVMAPTDNRVCPTGVFSSSKNMLLISNGSFKTDTKAAGWSSLLIHNGDRLMIISNFGNAGSAAECEARYNEEGVCTTRNM